MQVKRNLPNDRLFDTYVDDIGFCLLDGHEIGRDNESFAIYHKTTVTK